MSAKARVAVVIPCHDAARWLPAALSSLQDQTLAPVEVVVVDDGSSDRSAQIAVKLGVRCLQQERRGPAAARNRGIEATRAPLLAFLDADDAFLPDKLRAQAEHLARTDAVLSCTDAWSVRYGQRVARKNAGRRPPPTVSLEHLLEDNPVICSSVLVRREAVEEVGLFDEDPVLVATEDYDLWLRLTTVGPLAYLDRALVEYRIGDHQLSDDRRFLDGVDRIMEKVREIGADIDDLEARIARRRAGVRLDLAYHLARRGSGAEARRWLREARQLGAGAEAAWRTWVRSWIPPLRRK